MPERDPVKPKPSQKPVSRQAKAAEARQRQARVLRNFRKIHRWTGALLFFVFFTIAITGGLLGWKKHSGDLILPGTRSGSETDMRQWKPLHELYERATAHYLALYPDTDFSVERIEARPEKGILKVVFSPGFVGIQVDAASGDILHTGRRNSDLFENLHDGSFIDDWLGWDSGAFKVFYTSLSALALLLFTATGFWLWYGPKHLRRSRKG